MIANVLLARPGSAGTASPAAISFRFRDLYVSMFPPLPLLEVAHLPSTLDVAEDVIGHDRQVILTSQATHTERCGGAAMQYDGRANFGRLACGLMREAPQSDALAANSHRRHEPLMNANHSDARAISDTDGWVDA